MRRCLRVRSFFAPQLVAAAAWQAQRFCSCEGAFDGIEVARVSSRRTPAMSKPSPPLSSSLTASTPTSTPIIPEPYDLHRDLIEVVFNPMTGHTVRTTSPQMRALARIGIAAVNGDLTVVNPVALRAFHHTLTTDPATASRDTADWPRKMRDTLTSLARTTDEHAFPDNVTALLGELVRKRIHSRVAASVVGELRPEDIATPAVLKEGQQRVLDLAVLGHHLYIGGTAGTGKTDVLRAVRKALLQQGLRVGTTATTGIAAANLGGVTYHSLLGVNRDGEVRKLSTLTTLDVLIIDEASMMDKASFEKLDQVLRRERNDTRPFGGVQIIICGDFLQLEAIPNKRLGDKGSKLQFIFESVVFADHFVKVMLTEQVRQASHPEFSEGLLQLRRGVWPEAFDNIIKMVPSSEVASDDEMLLFCRKDDVLRVNAEKMAQLSGRTVAFEPFQQIPTLSGTWTDSMLLSVTPEFNEEEFIASIYVAMAQKFRQFSRRDVVGYKYLSDGYVVRLRLPFDLEPAQLAGRKARFAELMRNIDTLAAGQATVLPRTLTADSLVPYDVETALAATIEAHPVAQRQELKVGARVMLRQNLTATLVNGSTGVIVDFVEASRENLAANIRQNQWLAAVLDTYVQQSHLQHGADIPLLPVVRFPGVADPIAIPPVPVVVGGDALTHYYEMSVINVPLVPAYASTTHKAQGLTLNCRVRVHLERMWDCNHIVYVALSRVRRADQLSISGLDKKKILVNPKAVEFDQLIPHAVDTRIDSETVSGSNWFAVDRVPSARGTPSSSNANAASEVHTSPLLAKKQSDAARHASKASSGTNVAAHLRNRLKRNSASDKATQSKRIAAAAGMLTRPSFAAQRPFSLSGGPTTTSDD